jgi:hypothetical protein
MNGYQNFCDSKVRKQLNKPPEVFFSSIIIREKKGGIELEQAAQQTGFVCFCIVVTSSKYTERRLKAAS